MRKNNILGVSAVILGSCFLNMAQAQTSDVVVDLSVLDNLSPSLSSDIAAQPLFPVVKKSEAKHVAKKAPARKKAKPARKVVKAKPAPEKSAPVKVEVKTEEPKPVVETAPTVAVVAEAVPAAAEPQTAAPAENPASLQTDAVQSAVVASAPVVNEIRPVTEDEHIVVVDVEPVSPEQPAVVENQPQVKEAAEPVADQTAAAPKVSNILVFDDDVSDLTEAQKQQLEAIVSSFENPGQNKIAIFAYNLNDGVDTFKRKRLSLNRAVDVRSFLLQKGYKNFSIKVINIDSGSDKVNSVEVVEMK